MPVDPSAAAKFRSVLKHIVQCADFPQELLKSVQVGASEACTNAVKYGRHGPDSKISVCIQAKADELIIRMYYQGDPFVFSNYQQQDAYNGEEPGSGQLLMSRSFDEIHYHFRKGKTLSRLVKRAG